MPSRVSHSTELARIWPTFLLLSLIYAQVQVRWHLMCPQGPVILYTLLGVWKSLTGAAEFYSKPFLLLVGVQHLQSKPVTKLAIRFNLCLIEKLIGGGLVRVGRMGTFVAVDILG